MSDEIRHECAVALLRLRRSAAEQAEKCGCADFGGTKLSLLLEKQHNRGQDGAGAVTLALSPEAGKPAYNELKSASERPLADLLSLLAKRRRMNETVFLGHLRYATYGKGDVGFCHPFVHKAARLERMLFLAGNFNLTNTRELFDAYVDAGLVSLVAYSYICTRTALGTASVLTYVESALEFNAHVRNSRCDLGKQLFGYIIAEIH